MKSLEEEIAESKTKSESLMKLFKDLEEQATAVLEDHQKAQVERERDCMILWLVGGGCWLGDKALQGPGGAGYSCAGGSPKGTGREGDCRTLWLAGVGWGLLAGGMKVFKDLEEQATAVLEDRQKAQVEREIAGRFGWQGWGGGCWLGG